MSINRQLLVPDNYHAPSILKSTDDYLIIYKPPGMHSVPGKGNNIVQWCESVLPGFLNVDGRKEGEGGLLHRLDYETHGLLLAAVNQNAFGLFFAEQNNGNIIKSYDAVAIKTTRQPKGFPLIAPLIPPDIYEHNPFILNSFFRSYGPGAKQVRPVICDIPAEYASDHGNKYCTEITRLRIINPNKKNNDLIYHFGINLRRGFRHQIRCHLAWAGFPILNDKLYGGKTNSDFLALRARGIEFTDPGSGERVNYTLPELPTDFRSSAAR